MSAGRWTIERGASDYPAGLADLPRGERPRLHGIGRRAAVAGLAPSGAVTVVGARRASAYGLRLARELGADLARAGVTVVSGMARGIDSAAHHGALDAGGVTVAVLGCGPDVAYPASSRDLHEAIAADGAIVAEHPPGTPARAHQFPARNRIMAALAEVAVIVEAALPSGSLITADRAAELGRTVGAAPGQAGVRVAAGTNQLIKDGAHLVRDAADVLDLLCGVGAGSLRAVERRARPGPALDPALAAVLDVVEEGAGSVDRVAGEGRLDARAVAVALARLELLGYVAADPLGRFRRTSLQRPG